MLRISIPTAFWHIAAGCQKAKVVCLTAGRSQCAQEARPATVHTHCQIKHCTRLRDVPVLCPPLPTRAVVTASIKRALRRGVEIIVTMFAKAESSE